MADPRAQMGPVSQRPDRRGECRRRSVRRRGHPSVPAGTASSHSAGPPAGSTCRRGHRPRPRTRPHGLVPRCGCHRPHARPAPACRSCPAWSQLRRRLALPPAIRGSRRSGPPAPGHPHPPRHRLNPSESTLHSRTRSANAARCPGTTARAPARTSPELHDAHLTRSAPRPAARGRPSLVAPASQRSFAALPVRCAQPPFVELAVGVAGHGGDEVEGPGPFVTG